MPLHEDGRLSGVHACIVGRRGTSGFQGSTAHAACKVYGRGDKVKGLKEIRNMGQPLAETFMGRPLWRERDSLGYVAMCRAFSFSTYTCSEVGRAFARLKAAAALERQPKHKAALELVEAAGLAKDDDDGVTVDANFVGAVPSTSWFRVVLVAIFAALARERELRDTQHDEKVVDIEKLFIA
jgi:hypothetical protein